MVCKELTCINVNEEDFPVLTISLAPDNVFPLLPSDYLECDGETDTSFYGPFVQQKYISYVTFSSRGFGIYMYIASAISPHIMTQFVGKNFCILRFQESEDIWILGDVFIEAYYTHFDAKVMIDMDNVEITYLTSYTPP